ncbi:hypothetical protein H0E87_026633 [Populus deltoides]|uniref:Uncharacterized protein n=1 Tax=Populus deltoides TaxID=3696 RepID=A0A8T2WWX0_POPDE|nr:hypothetical protein H0E87_026633 [Populus deltoides]
MEGREEDVRVGANKYGERQPIGTAAQAQDVKDYTEPPPAPLFEPGELSSWSFYRAGIAEFVATFLFLYITVLTVMGVAKSPTKCSTVGIQGIAWAFGGMIFALVYCTAGISGGHINPAVTFGLLLARKLSLTRAVFYMLMQCLGAICGAAVVKAFQKSQYEMLGGGANTVSTGYAKGSGLGAEIIGTFVLVYTVFSATDAKRNARDSHVPILAPLPIGFAVFLVHLATIPITGTGINPARSLGAALIYNKDQAWDDHWIFWVGPFIGAALASLYHQIEDQIGDGVVGDAVTSRGVSPSKVTSFPTGSVDRLRWKRKMVVTLALTILTSSQAILIVWSKRAGKYEYSVTTANFMVETLKCALSLAALARTWKKEGVTEDNRLSTTFDEVKVYPIPAALYLVKNLLQYYIFAYVNAPGYQILKNLNIISTGVLYRIILKRKLSEVQWAGFILLCAGCTTAQLNPTSDHVLETPLQGWMMAIVMALLSGFAGVYTEAIIKKRPSRNINVQNFWLYVFGMIFNALAIVTQDFDAVVNKGFFYGYSLITTLMILNHALSGIAVSMVMKFADNIVKVYSTSVAMLLTAVVSVFLFDFHLSLAFFLGSTVVSVSVYLHSVGKMQR